MVQINCLPWKNGLEEYEMPNQAEKILIEKNTTKTPINHRTYKSPQEQKN